MLVIGIGQAYAGDDAAGRRVAEGLTGHPAIDVAESAGIAADILMRFEGRDRVLLVDACRSGAAPGTILRLDARRDALPPGLAGTSTHGMGVTEAVRLAEVLGALPESLTIWAIEGTDFTLGAPMHPAVESAVRECVAEIAALGETLARPTLSRCEAADHPRVRATGVRRRSRSPE